MTKDSDTESPDDPLEDDDLDRDGDIEEFLRLQGAPEGGDAPWERPSWLGPWLRSLYLRWQLKRRRRK